MPLFHLNIANLLFFYHSTDIVLLQLGRFSVLGLLVVVISILLIIALIGMFFRAKKIKGKYDSLEKLHEDLLKERAILHEAIDRQDAEYNHLSKLNAIFLKDLESLKKQLAEAVKMAEEADLLKTNFLANMSHEIRTPMNGIIGFAQILKKQELDRENQLEYLDIISKNGTVLINLIDDIIDLSKIEAGHLSFEKAIVNLDDLMLDIFTFFEHIKVQQGKDNLHLKLNNFNDGEEKRLLTDEKRLYQVISNLLNNAIKFTHSGVVEFGYRTNKKAKTIEFFVKDSGIGIPEDMQQNIFDKFRQVEKGATRMYGGTGIGLFISKTIVELMGGNIKVQSVVGEGSEFIFSIPFEETIPQQGAPALLTHKEKKYNWSDKKIVIAEDVETNFKLLSAILEKTSATIVWTKDGDEVIRYCLENPNVDIVLMDMQMPKINGLDATIRIKKDLPHIKIIAQTAFALPNDNIRCIQAGCDDYIAKPINAELLLDKISALIKTREKV